MQSNNEKWTCPERGKTVKRGVRHPGVCNCQPPKSLSEQVVEDMKKLVIVLQDAAIREACRPELKEFSDALDEASCQPQNEEKEVKCRCCYSCGVAGVNHCPHCPKEKYL